LHLVTNVNLIETEAVVSATAPSSLTISVLLLSTYILTYLLTYSADILLYL